MQHIRTLFFLRILLSCVGDFSEDYTQARVHFSSAVLHRVPSPAFVLSLHFPSRWDGCLLFLGLKGGGDDWGGLGCS